MTRQWHTTAAGLFLSIGLFSYAGAQVVPSANSYAITFGSAGTQVSQTSDVGRVTFSENFGEHLIWDRTGQESVLVKAVAGNSSMGSYGLLQTSAHAAIYQGRLPFGHELNEFTYNDGARTNGKGAAYWHDYWTVTGPALAGGGPILVTVRGTLSYSFSSYLANYRSDDYFEGMGFFFGNTGAFNVSWDTATIKALGGSGGAAVIAWEQTLGFLPGQPMHITQSIYAELDARVRPWDGQLHSAFFSNALSTSISSIQIIQPARSLSADGHTLATPYSAGDYELISASGSLVKSGDGYNYLAALAVPEPATSGSLLLGLGVLGWALRRRSSC